MDVSTICFIFVDTVFLLCGAVLFMSLINILPYQKCLVNIFNHKMYFSLTKMHLISHLVIVFYYYTSQFMRKWSQYWLVTQTSNPNKIAYKPCDSFPYLSSAHQISSSPGSKIPEAKERIVWLRVFVQRMRLFLFFSTALHH